MKDKTALTARQKRFVEEYLAGGDAAEAAIAAGSAGSVSVSMAFITPVSRIFLVIARVSTPHSPGMPACCR